MSLFDTVSEAIKPAMLARDKVRLEALRGIKKEFIEARTAPGSGGELTDEAALKILTRMVKQRRESAQIYTEQGRPELAENELAEARVIEEFLPARLSETELKDAVAAIINQLGATSPAEMGKVMGVASRQLAGKADGKDIAATVRMLLAQNAAR